MRSGRILQCVSCAVWGQLRAPCTAPVRSVLLERRFAGLEDAEEVHEAREQNGRSDAEDRIEAGKEIGTRHEQQVDVSRDFAHGFERGRRIERNARLASPTSLTASYNRRS